MGTYGRLFTMNLTRRLPGLLLAVVAIALTAVIAGRVSAGADPAPQDTQPIVLETTQAPSSPTPTPTPSASPSIDTDDDDDDDRVKPRLRDDDDDDGPDDDDDDDRFDDRDDD